MAELTDTMICWNRGGDVALIPWPDRTGASDQYSGSTGASYAYVRDMNFEQRKTFAFIEAVILIVHEGCDPQKVNEVFLGLDEYVNGLPDDALPKHMRERRWREEDE